MFTGILDGVSALLVALLLLFCIWWFERQRQRKVKEKLKAKVDAMIKRTQKVCQARLRENRKKEGESMNQ